MRSKFNLTRQYIHTLLYDSFLFRKQFLRQISWKKDDPMEHLSHPSKEPQFQDLLVSIEYVICMKRKNSQGSGAIATLV